MDTDLSRRRLFPSRCGGELEGEERRRMWSEVLGRIVLFVRVRVRTRLDRAGDPRQTLDYAYAQQQELLRQVRQGVIDVATSKRLLEQQTLELADQMPARKTRPLAPSQRRWTTWRASRCRWWTSTGVSRPTTSRPIGL